jgi:hypothetical protein
MPVRLLPEPASTRAPTPVSRAVERHPTSPPGRIEIKLPNGICIRTEDVIDEAALRTVILTARE